MVLYTHTHTIHLENRKATTKNEINIKELYESTKVNEQNKDITMFSKNKENAITLIALVITIIVLLILAGVSIAMLTGTNGILTQAQKAKLSTELSSYKEQLELYKTEKFSENRGFLESTLTVGKESLTYNTQPEGETGNIKTVIPSIKDEYIDKVEIIKGSLLINTQDKNEIEIAKSLGIAANPYDIVNGELVSSNGNLLLMDETGSLTIPNNVTKIGQGAFANLGGLKTIIIPGTVKEIGEDAFAYNPTLETVIIQEGVEKIDARAFQQCTVLKNVQLPESLTDLQEQVFYADVKLEKIKIPSKIKAIYGFTFSACGLKEVKLPSQLETIGQEAFGGTKLSEITLPETVEKIDSTAFARNKNLNNIILEGKNNNFVYENGMLMTKNKDKILFISDSYLKNITTFTIPSGITSFIINLSGYENITKLVIPKETISVRSEYLPKSISDIEVDEDNPRLAVSKEKKILYTKDNKKIVSCFSKEETIDLKDEKNEMGITGLAYASFYQAINAKHITLPDSLTAIADFTFNNCTNVQEIRIGKNVSNIGNLFKYLNYSGNIIIDEANPYYTVENKILYNKNKTTLYSVLYEINGEFIVPDGVEKIGDRALHAQWLVSKIKIPSSVKYLGDCFNYCTSLTSIDIPSNVESIGWSCFNECSNLSTINIYKKENSIEGAPWKAPKGMKIVNWKK